VYQFQDVLGADGHIIQKEDCCFGVKPDLVAYQGLKREIPKRREVTNTIAAGGGVDIATEKMILRTESLDFLPEQAKNLGGPVLGITLDD
jgi:hypothetical protein